MTERILGELKNIKESDKDLHQVLKQFVSKLIIDKAEVTQFESYSAQQRISGGTQESVYKVR